MDRTRPKNPAVGPTNQLSGNTVPKPENILTGGTDNRLPIPEVYQYHIFNDVTRGFPSGPNDTLSSCDFQPIYQSYNRHATSTWKTFPEAKRFGGEDGSGFEDWVSRFDLVCHCNGCFSNDDKADTSLLALKGMQPAM